MFVKKDGLELWKLLVGGTLTVYSLHKVPMKILVETRVI